MRTPEHVSVMSKDRVDLPSIVELMRSGEFKPRYTLAELKKLAHEAQSEVRRVRDTHTIPDDQLIVTKKALRIFKELKSERNACVAFFLKDIWPIYRSLAEQAEPTDSWQTYITLQQELFSHAVSKWSQTTASQCRRTEEQNKPYCTAYAHFAALMQYSVAAELADKNTSPSSFIEGGFGTSLEALFSVANMIITNERKLDPAIQNQELHATVAHALKTISVQLAVLDANISIPLICKMQTEDSTHQFRAEFFNRNADKRPTTYSINWEAIEKAFPETEEEVIELLGNNTGCPAFVTASRENVNALRDHMVIVQKYIFEHLLPHDHVTKPAEDRPAVALGWHK